MRRIVILCFALVWLGCSGSPETKAEESAAAKAGDVSAPNGAPSDSSEEADRGLESLPGTSAVEMTTIDWGDGDRLLIGWADGSFATVDPASSRHDYFDIAKKDYPVSAIAPSGKFALLDSSPPAVLAADGQAVLQMNPVKSYEGASFARDNLGVYVSDSDGKVRIWGQTHSFEDDLTKEKLEDYLNRQAPDFHVQFKPLSGPIRMSSDGLLLVGAADGTISIWNPRKPSSSKQVMKLKAPVRDFDAAGGVVVATSREGQLKVGTLSPPSYKAWSREARGDYADVSNLLVDQFVSQSGATVALREVETGEAIWSRDLPGRKACGVAVSQSARRIAACVDQNIVILDAEDGTAQSVVFKIGDTLGWKTPSGDDVAP